MNLRKIALKFRNRRQLSIALGIPSTTVDRWASTNVVPWYQIEAVIEAANRRGIVIEPEDFLPDFPINNPKLLKKSG